MENEKLCRALRRMKVETGSFACFGCGYEHRCGVLGCALIREAADRLEADYARRTELLARIGELEEKQRWRRPWEDMPPEDEIVLVIADGQVAENITADNAVMMASWSKEDGWMLEEYPKTETGFKVKYWMPLPEAPEQERGERK